MLRNNSYTVSDFYRSYKIYTGNTNLYNVGLDKFRQILNDYFKHLTNEIIIKAKEVTLPARFGVVYVIKSKPKSYEYKYLRVDFKSTNESEKTIMHLNEHSDGYNYMFHWKKSGLICTNKSYYELVMSRKNKRELAKSIKNKVTDYIEKRR